MPRLLQRLQNDRRGNTAVITALLMVPLIGVAGGALDYGRLQVIHSRLADAADAASVGAVAKNGAGMMAASNMSGDGSVADGAAAATSLFNANTASIRDIDVSNLETSVVKSGLQVTATVSVQASMPTYFLGIMGITTMRTSASSVSTNSLPTFINFYLLLDNTPSMGVGATPADVSKMVANTSDQCAFACHDLSNPTRNYYRLAKNLGVTTRIDVLRSATASLMDTAAATALVSNQFSMGVYTFGASSASPGFYQVAAPSPNLAAVKTLTSAIDLMTVPYQNYNNDQDTDFANVLTGANSAMPNPGTGKSAKSPQEVLFLVSDGVNDSSVNGSRSITTIDTSLCTTIKDRGIKIAVLYTTYLPLPTNSFYNSYVAPWVDTISPTMQACASPGLFFEVSPTAGVSQAMAALFQKAVQNARISQ
jgi:Flp pilus assembly protein TadG